jgi:hypothetical protein
LLKGKLTMENYQTNPKGYKGNRNGVGYATIWLAIGILVGFLIAFAIWGRCTLPAKDGLPTQTEQTEQIDQTPQPAHTERTIIAGYVPSWHRDEGAPGDNDTQIMFDKAVLKWIPMWTAMITAMRAAQQ